jgi:hypothetical protein
MCREPTADLLTTQLGRRLWWSLVSQDAYTASTSGFTYLVNLSHASTGRFANVDEEDIRGGSAYHSRPLTETTAATFHIAKIDFALGTYPVLTISHAPLPTH